MNSVWYVTYHDYRHSGSVVEHPLCDREVAGSIPSQVIPKTLKMVLVLFRFRLALSIKKVELGIRTGQLSVSIMWLGGISCQSVWGMIFQWGSTLKVSIELPVTSRHRRDMTERLLKATLSPNQTNKQTKTYHDQPNPGERWASSSISMSVVKQGKGSESFNGEHEYCFSENLLR